MLFTETPVSFSQHNRRTSGGEVGLYGESIFSIRMINLLPIADL